MGADGHLLVYDSEKLKVLIPNFEIKGFGIYEREILGKKVITQYWDTEYHDFYCLVCGEGWCNEHQQRYDEALIGDWEVWT